MIVKLSEIAEYSKGQQINGDELIADGKFDYLNGGINSSGKWNSSNVCGNTVTISEGGNSCGYVNYMEKPFWCGAHCYYLYNVKGNSKYLYYALKSYQDKIMRLRSGACMPNIKKRDLGNLELNYSFDDKEQKHIVDVLDKLTDLITQSKRQLELMDELVKARFVEMFGDMITNPNKWDKVSLGMACDVRDGTHDSPKYYNEGYPLVTSKNVTSGKIDFKDCNLICKEDYQKINERSKVDLGDILMPMIGTVGKPVIVDIEAQFAIKNVALIKFNKSSKVINIFVKSLLQSDYFDNAVISKIRGGTQKFIALGDIRKLEIFLPPKDRQEQFATFVKQTDKSKLAVKQVLEKAETLKKALMQKYFG